MRTGAERELPFTVETRLKAAPAVFLFFFIFPAVDREVFSDARVVLVCFRT